MNNENYEFGKFVCLSKEAEEDLKELSDNELEVFSNILAEAISQTIAKIEAQYENN